MKLLRAIFCVAAMLAQLACALAEPVFDVSGLEGSRELLTFRGIIKSDQPAIGFEVPGQDGKPTVMNLDAKGPGPEFTWYAYSLVNSGEAPQELVFVVPQSRFTSSGLLSPSPPGTRIIQIVTSNPDIAARSVVQDGADAVAFALPPKSALTVAVQGDSGTPVATLWQRNSFDFVASQLLASSGAILGISALILIAACALVSIRPHSVTISGAVFTALALLFMLFESGSLFRYAAVSELTGLPQQSIRAILETLLMIGAALCLYTFTGIASMRPHLGILVLVTMGVGVANLVLAAVEPDRAVTVGRIAFMFVALAGFPIVLTGKQLGSQQLGGSTAFWLALLAWSLLAAVLALLVFQDTRLAVVLHAGLCAVLITLAYALMRFSFGEGYLAKAHVTDQVRRSLALAGARHHLWDWSPADGEIDYDDGFSQLLGYRQGMLEDGGQETFIELLHPEDRNDFIANADAVASGQAKTFDQEFRLKAADGYYSWYALRARVLPGKGTADLRCIGTLTDISKSKELEERLIEDSVHDPVTGLPSRAIFMDRLERSAASRNALPVHVLLVDLDRFKSLNDGLGHDIGDQLLHVAGSRIVLTAGDDATVARMAGSEFAILHPVTANGRDPEQLAEAIGLALAEPIETGASPAHLTASMGISLRSAYGVNADELLAQAASALHAARMKGPGSVVVYDSSLRDDRAADVALESDLRRAIGRAELEVHYQPIMQLTTLDIVGFEALARWRHPRLGLVAPENFISAAERTGLISELGQFVLSEAARQLGQWQRTLFRNRSIFISVNVSGTHFLSEVFPQHVQQILAREQLQPGSLKIEITESVIVRYPERVERLFNYLRNHGIGLACDDFGAGFSSLASLRDLPFDTLKMDRSFISGDQIEPRAAHIVAAVVEMARGLGMLVVAEGVENQMQIEQLAALGCDLGQGFFLGAPVSAITLEELLSPKPLVAIAHANDRTFASTNLSNGQFAAQPPPGTAPMAPRISKQVLDDYEPLQISPPVEVRPERLPSIFEVAKGPKTTKKRPRKSTRKRAPRSQRTSETQA